jgi:predicted nucleotidyltransferase
MQCKKCRWVDLIVQVVLVWAKAQPKKRAVALVGSHARGTARPDSDIDLMLLTTDPHGFRADTAWVEQIDWHAIDTLPHKWQDEDYGVVWSRRIWLEADRGQVELTFAPLSWADVKLLDTGTRGVVSGGCRILYDPDALLASVCELVNRLIEHADLRNPC